MESGSGRPGKKARVEVKSELEEENLVYKLKVLLPNGATVGLKLCKPAADMSVRDLIHQIKRHYTHRSHCHTRRDILWDNPHIFLRDAHGFKIANYISFTSFQPNRFHYLTLHDGAHETVTFENMWDLTPDTDMLMELPEEYTFETALADLIDNSLQAVWSNGPNERRLVCVEIDEHKISVFDSGAGMDGSEKNSIAKWGKMGASLNRSARGLAIGGQPPYLTPFFGMFGYGGAIATMHLGRHAVVSSKTKESKKVYTLHLEREVLLSRSGEKTWKTDGGIKDPAAEEINLSPHESFTKVEIFEPKLRSVDSFQLKCRLKDIYFPYIQCDEMLATGKTTRPIEFQVNGEDLAELQGGEVAISNLLSCNGPEFVLQLHFSINQDAGKLKSSGSRAIPPANARLKFVYFPIVEGKESIDRILEALNAEQCGILETFDTFSRVSIRRLGRLLPDDRWARFPFMEPRLRKGDRAQVLKRCCMRIKCFVETDAGFNPTPSKTDLAHHHPYTTALKNFGNKSLGIQSDASIEIYKGGKLLSLPQMEKEYEDWVFQMHDGYDEEVVCGEDQPVLVVSPQNKKGFCISSDVVRVHQVIRRKGVTWKAGQHIKIFKGAVGCHKNNLYATLEYILLEGFQGDVGGEARLICRPLDVPLQRGCLLDVHSGNASLDIRGSISFPLSVIDSGKCKLMEISEWKQQLQKRNQKSPAKIDVLAARDCQHLEINGALPTNGTVSAGYVTPEKIVAVIRPVLYDGCSLHSSLEQKSIIKDDVEMSMEVTYTTAEDDDHQGAKHLYGGRTKPSSLKGIQGLYIFSLGSKLSNLFHCAGIYTFSFTANSKGSSHKVEKTVRVVPSTEVSRWRLLTDGEKTSYHVRVGECFPHLSIASFDIYNNRMPFVSIPELVFNLKTKGSITVNTDRMKVDLSSNKMILKISGIWMESENLDGIQPDYKALLEIYSKDDLFSVNVSCSVTPGPIHNVKILSMIEKYLLPGEVVEELQLEMLDRYGNRVEKGLGVSVDVDGFRFQDHKGSKREVDNNGCVDLSGLLKVIAGYGKIVSLSVGDGEEEYFRKEFQVEERILRILSVVPDECPASTKLENIIFEIVNSEGVVDETIHDDMKFGGSHTLKIVLQSSEGDDIFHHSFRRGRCIVPFIVMPQQEGMFRFVAAYSEHPDLCMDFKVHVTQRLGVHMVSLNDHEDLMSSHHSDEGTQHSNEGMLVLQESSVYATDDMRHLIESFLNDEKVLEKELSKIAMRIGKHEELLDILQNKMKDTEQEICDLEALLEPWSLRLVKYFMNEMVTLKRIEGKADTAASVFCQIPKAIQSKVVEECMQDIIGIVALLGTVSNDSLSRMLAQYLGEDHMLAVVCKSYSTASTLESYEKHGEVDRGRALHGIATGFGKSISRRFLVICLEEISPYKGEIKSNDRQRKLALPDPLLPTGKIPPGYLGYAVNLINLDAVYLDTRTAKGHGLRETLFYLLFGELQVYKTREYLKEARTYINHGAVSLDGGIMKENGIISLGYCEPEVCFSVASSEVQRLSTDAMTALRQISHKRLELESIRDEIDQESKAHSETKRKFEKKRDKYQKFMNEKEPMLTGIYLEYGQCKEKKGENPFC